MSVAVYNHYKRLYNNLPAPSTTPAAKPSQNSSDPLNGLVASSQDPKQRKPSERLAYALTRRSLRRFCSQSRNSVLHAAVRRLEHEHRREHEQ